MAQAFSKIYHDFEGLIKAQLKRALVDIVKCDSAFKNFQGYVSLKQYVEFDEIISIKGSRTRAMPKNTLVFMIDNRRPSKVPNAQSQWDIDDRVNYIFK